MEGRLSLKVTNVCTLVLDEGLPKPCHSRIVGQVLLEMPKDYHSVLGPVLMEHVSLFKMQLGRTI